MFFFLASKALSGMRVWLRRVFPPLLYGGGDKYLTKNHVIVSEILEKFELYVDDTTELSSQQELDLCNKTYQNVCSDREWQFLKVEASGSMTTTTTIALPTRFSHMLENFNYTDNSISTQVNSKPIVVFINGDAKRVVNWSDRRQYENNNSICYVDLNNSVIVFPKAQSSGATYSFDYQEFPVDLILTDTPVFPARFHHALFHGMCVEDMAIQLFDKARSNVDFNKGMYQSYVSDMGLWDAKLQMN